MVIRANSVVIIKYIILWHRKRGLSLMLQSGVEL